LNSDRHRFFRSAGIVSAAVSLSRVTGLVREMIMARLFGAGAVYDAFLLGFRIPNLSRNLFAEGALSSAFIPVFTQCLATRGKREAAHLSNALATALIVVVGALCIVGMIFSPQLVRLMAPGFEQVPGKFQLTVTLTRIMFPFLALVTLAAQAMGVLNAYDRYGIPATASAMFNIGSVGFGLVFGFTAGRALGQDLIVSMAYGVLAGGVLQLLWQLPSMRRFGLSFRPCFDLWHPGLRQILRLMLPAVLGGAAMQVNVVVNTNLASSITDAAGNVISGPVSWLGYAFRFVQLPIGVFGVALASATLPAISRSAALRQMEDFRDTMARSLGSVMLLTIPSSVGLAVLGESMIGIVYEGRNFHSSDTRQTAMALACYSVGLAGYSAIKILAPAFYALGDARTPMLVSVASIAVNLAAALALLRFTALGHAGLALSASCVSLFGAAALFAVLRARVDGLHGHKLASSALRIALASVVMGAVCRASSYAIHLAIAAPRTAQFADVAISIPLGVAIFYVLARRLQIEELEAVRAACYTSIRNAPRPEVGDPPPRNR
jgi:putative peptidoglycan lipid II flippase